MELDYDFCDFETSTDFDKALTEATTTYTTRKELTAEEKSKAESKAYELLFSAADASPQGHNNAVAILHAKNEADKIFEEDPSLTSTATLLTIYQIAIDYGFKTIDDLIKAAEPDSKFRN